MEINASLPWVAAVIPTAAMASAYPTTLASAIKTASTPTMTPCLASALSSATLILAARLQASAFVQEPPCAIVRLGSRQPFLVVSQDFAASPCGVRAKPRLVSLQNARVSSIFSRRMVQVFVLTPFDSVTSARPMSTALMASASHKADASSKMTAGSQGILLMFLLVRERSCATIKIYVNAMITGSLLPAPNGSTLITEVK